MSLPPYFVYILTNTHHTVLYVGMTDDIWKRVNEHRDQIHPNSFTAKYNVWKLVYAERQESAFDALKREKEIKGWRRDRKLDLIKANNPEWLDLLPEYVQENEIFTFLKTLR